MFQQSQDKAEEIAIPSLHFAVFNLQFAFCLPHSAFCSTSARIMRKTSVLLMYWPEIFHTSAAFGSLPRTDALNRVAPAPLA